MTIPNEIHGQKYVSLVTFRKSGDPVHTPVWFAEQDDKLYVRTRNDSGKCKRLRSNPHVRVAPCTMTGRVKGPEFSGKGRILPPELSKQAKQLVNRKYWMARLSLGGSNNVYLEIEVVG
jgi:uncharacterized protein